MAHFLDGGMSIDKPKAKHTHSLGCVLGLAIMVGELVVERQCGEAMG